MADLFAIDFSQLHLLRPLALLGLIPALLLVALAQWRKRSAGNWEKVINPELLPFLMQGNANQKQRGLLWVALAWSIACLALAGPTWQQLPQPVHKKDAALILIMDLSPSMLAEDIKPSRLARARYKLIDILKNRQEGFSALVVYGGEAFTLAPLTEDSNTIISLVPVLHPTLLPEYGSNTEAAIETALELALNGGYQQADLLLITDEVAAPAFPRIRSMISKAGNFRLSILGVGSQQGAPIPTGAGGFAKDINGAIVIPKLSPGSLNRLAADNGGVYVTISADDSDIETLLDSTSELFPDATKELERSFDLWDDQGYWLIFLLLPVVLLSFRKGNIAVLVLSAPLLFSDPVAANSWQQTGKSLWQDLWKTPDQQASDALRAGDAATAQQLFDDPQWRGSAAYKAGDYQSAIDDFVTSDSADAHYNRGNALAHAGDLDAAIDAYNQALELAPAMEDAVANKELLEQLKQQQEQQQDQQQDQQDSSDQQQQQDQQSDSQQKQNQDQEQNQDQQQDSSQDSQQEPEENRAQDKEPQQDKEQDQEPQQNKEQDKEQDQEQEQNSEENKQPETEQNQQQDSAASAEESEEEKQAQQELEQWLRRVPDDPGGLLREKFRYQSRQRALERRRPAPPNDDQQRRW